MYNKYIQDRNILIKASEQVPQLTIQTVNMCITVDIHEWHKNLQIKLKEFLRK